MVAKFPEDNKPKTSFKVIPLFCTAHPLLRITLLHPRWRRFFPLARKEQTRAAFAELKLLFAIIMPQIGWQLPGLLSKNKKMKEMCVIPKSAVVFTSQASSCGIIKMSWLRLWIVRTVKPVGQLYGSWKCHLKSEFALFQTSTISFNFI